VILANALVNASANAPINLCFLKTTEAILRLLGSDPDLTRKEMAFRIKRLQDNGRLQRIGFAKTGHWELL